MFTIHTNILAGLTLSDTPTKTRENKVKGNKYKENVFNTIAVDQSIDTRLHY